MGVERYAQRQDREVAQPQQQELRGQLDPRQHPDLRGQLDLRGHIDQRQQQEPRGQLDLRQHPDLRGHIDQRQQPDVRVHIDELVLDGFSPRAAELPAGVAAQVSAVLVDRGMPPETAAQVSAAVSAQVARSLNA